MLLLGDSISTDDISPVSNITTASVAGEYLTKTYSTNYLHTFGIQNYFIKLFLEKEAEKRIDNL